MIVYSEEVHAELSARHYLYELFHILLGNAPTEELLQAIDGKIVQESFFISTAKDSEDAEVGQFFSRIEGFKDVSLEALQSDYAVVFEGPESLPAPPWESVYTSNKRLLFQKSTLEIRNIYRSQGLLPSLYPRVADDHISLELDYLSHLAQRSLEAFVAQDEESYAQAMAANKAFLVDHLGVWVGSFADDLAKWKSDSFYTYAAKTLEVFIRNEITNLEVICAE
ncbi:MAG: molecular chaperone TorD family protein [Raoultibacter sp.]